MDETWVMDLGRRALETMLLVGGPLLALALIVGLLVSVFQALTQINEATLSFIPKILAMGAGILIMGPWMLQSMVNFTTQLYENLNLYLR